MCVQCIPSSRAYSEEQSNCVRVSSDQSKAERLQPGRHARPGLTFFGQDRKSCTLASEMSIFDKGLANLDPGADQ